MSAWLRNIQGQLSDLANEVLNEANDVLAEAREEVADPDAELTVAKKNCAEAEKQLAISSAKCESLENEKKHLEQQLYDSHVEMDAIGVKLNGMVRQRDDEIKKLKNQINQINDNNESGWNEVPLMENGAPRAQEEPEISKKELESRLEEQRLQKEHEIQALIESHAESILELREMYEEKLQQMQILSSSTTSNADCLDAVMLEKMELCDKKSSAKSSSGSEPVVVDLGSHEELVDERIRQIEQEKSEIQAKSEKSVESLRAQNQELTAAYNELFGEFEQFKATNTATETRNHDLNHRIDSLKANLIEYEERYELCKKENQETVAQLEKLSSEFERLRNGVANVTTRRENADIMIDEEVEKLRAALDESRAERERLREDVQKFQVSVGEIDVELEKLRDANRQLLAENQALTMNLSNYDVTMKDVLANSEKDIGAFREQFHEIQENHKLQREAVLAENAALREETEAIKKQRDILMEESNLLKEVNLKLKQKSTTEESKLELLQQKAELLEKLLQEERAQKQENEQEKHQKEQDPEIEMLRTHLREALKANTEKSEECENLKDSANQLEREVELRQNCVDEMIAQTNTLQLQQETLSAQNKTLQNQILANERQIVQLEEQVREQVEKKEELEQQVKQLEGVIMGSEGSESSQEKEHILKRYCETLQEKLRATQTELDELRTLKTCSDKTQAEARSQLEHELYEAEQVDRGLLEGIETRVQEMEGQLLSKMEQLEQAKSTIQQLAEQNEQLAEQQSIMEEELKSKELGLIEQVSELAALRQQIDELQEQNHAIREQTSHGNQETAAKIQILEQEKSELEEAVKNREQSANIDVAELRNSILQLQQENEYLKGVAQTHHDENVKYYEQLQAMAAQHQNALSQLEEHEKRAKELQRLREHLMIVEENSTREAVEAEQRETELRARVRELETKGNEVAHGASESTQQYQVQIAALTSKVEGLERNKMELEKKYQNEIRIREQNQEALGSLQNVVRELSVDHERDAATASHRNLELQARIMTLSEELSQLREELDRQSISRQAAEEETDRRQLQLASKQKIIEDLELQIEELRAPAKSSESSSYRIDDSTLRQLFLSYFVAEPAKKTDIALLLASILEYPPDEMDKFRQALKAPKGGGASSITEQFIRFLEVESESSRTAPHLPMRNQSEPPAGLMLHEPKKAPSPSPNASGSSSAAALDSLLR